MKISIEQLNEILTLAEKYEYKPDEWHRKNLANSCGSDEIVSMVRELIAIRELKGEQVPVAWRHKGKAAITVYQSVADEWVNNGWPVEKLFTSPQKPVVLPKLTVGEVMHLSGYDRQYAEGWVSANDNAIREIETAGGVVKGGE